MNKAREAGVQGRFQWASVPFHHGKILWRVRWLKRGYFLELGGRSGFGPSVLAGVDLLFMHVLSPPSGISRGWPFFGQPA